MIISDTSANQKRSTSTLLASLNFPEAFPASISRVGFISLLQQSPSLSKLEKLKILLEVPRLPPKRFLELNETFTKEQDFLINCVENSTNSESTISNRKSQAERDWPEVVRHWENLLKHAKLYKHSGSNYLDGHNLLTPRALNVLLDSRVIGQNDVTRRIANFVHKRMYAYHIAQESSVSSIPNPDRVILLAGLTGTGKSFTIQNVCQLADLAFVHINTACMVEEGIVGTSVSDIGREILRKSDNDVKRAEHAIVFLDEFDKTMSGSAFGNTVVNQLLRIIEGAEISIQPNRWDDAGTRPAVSSLRTNDMFFILGGAFQNLLESKTVKKFGYVVQSQKDKTTADVGRKKTAASLCGKDLVELGFPKELDGRINAILTLKPLSEEDFYSILKSDSSPLREYFKIVRSYGDDVKISEDALREIARQAAKIGLGARSLHKIACSVFEDILYESPNPAIETFLITREKVLEVIEGDW